ncbi:hypothetical protein FPV67DRAFT_870796 [Lyophyllum atratum]|nr:hypothetical protein FPV67DRAFT_870796 [Lyophyllum atratum]
MIMRNPWNFRSQDHWGLPILTFCPLIAGVQLPCRVSRSGEASGGAPPRGDPYTYTTCHHPQESWCRRRPRTTTTTTRAQRKGSMDGRMHPRQTSSTPSPTPTPSSSSSTVCLPDPDRPPLSLLNLFDTMVFQRAEPASSTTSESSTTSSSSTTPPPSSSSSSSSEPPPESSSSSSSRPPPPSSSSEPPEPSSTPSSSSQGPSSSDSSSSSSSHASGSSSPPPPPTPTPTFTPTPTTFPINTASSNFTESLTTLTTIDQNGNPTTIITPAPTALSPSPTSKHTSLKRTAAIAGATTASVLLLLLLLAATFLYRRHRRKLHERLQTLLRPRRRTREDRGLLDGEDFFEEDEEGERGMALRAYRDASVAGSRATTPGMGAEPLRVQDVGGLGMGRIIDDVMGPAHVAEWSNSTTGTTTTAYTGLPPTTHPIHAADPSSSSASLYTDPFRSASPSPNANTNTNREGSVYYALPPPPSSGAGGLPPGAAPPKRLGYRSGTVAVGRAVEGVAGALHRGLSFGGRK